MYSGRVFQFFKKEDENARIWVILKGTILFKIRYSTIIVHLSFFENLSLVVTGRHTGVVVGVGGHATLWLPPRVLQWGTAHTARIMTNVTICRTKKAPLFC